MIVKTTAIPLAYYPWSSTSRIVHWLTRTHGKVSTLLKGALRPKSPFLGEYDLFGTSELLFFARREEALHTGKECALLRRRGAFHTDWRAMQAASYIAYLFDRATPDEAPQHGQFEYCEELLDLAAEHGRHPLFLGWAELDFCSHMGQAPRLDRCILCAETAPQRFCASQGGVVCSGCAKVRQLPTLPCPADVLAILRGWQRAGHPGLVARTRPDPGQFAALNAIMATFMAYQFNVQPEHRAAALVMP